MLPFIHRLQMCHKIAIRWEQQKSLFGTLPGKDFKAKMIKLCFIAKHPMNSVIPSLLITVLSPAMFI